MRERERENIRTPAAAQSAASPHDAEYGGSVDRVRVVVLVLVLLSICCFVEMLPRPRARGRGEYFWWCRPGGERTVYATVVVVGLLLVVVVEVDVGEVVVSPPALGPALGKGGVVVGASLGAQSRDDGGLETRLPPTHRESIDICVSFFPRIYIYIYISRGLE